LPTKEEARLCASVVKKVSRTRGISKDPAAISNISLLDLHRWTISLPVDGGLAIS